MNSCVVICNPKAGSFDEKVAARISEALPGATVEQTRQAGDARRLAAQACRDGAELIVSAGGDGTLNEVVNGLGEKPGGTRLAILPLGTGNDFGRSLELPDSIEENLELIAAGHTRPVDLVRVTSEDVRYFLNVSAGGFSGLVDEKLTTEMKKTWGPLAYLRSAVEALPELKGYRTSLVLDDKEELEVDLYNAVFANGRCVAGGYRVAPEASLDDGLLDIVLVKIIDAAEMAVLIPQMLAGAHLESDHVIFRRARKVSVSSQPGIWFNVDGELVGNQPALFEVLPRALEVVAPLPHE